MNRLIYFIIFLLLFGYILTELHMFLYWKWPFLEGQEYYPFLDPDYKEPITALFYTYEVMAIVNEAITHFTFGLVAKLNSIRLYTVLMIFCFFDFVKLLFYMWNRNTSWLHNYITYSMVICCIIGVLRKDKKKGKYKSIF